MTEPENSNVPEPASAESVDEPESIIDSPPTETEEIFVDSDDVANPPPDTSSVKTSDPLSPSRINDAIEAALQDMDILDEKVSYFFFVIYELIYYGLQIPCVFAGSVFESLRLRSHLIYIYIESSGKLELQYFEKEFCKQTGSFCIVI